MKNSEDFRRIHEVDLQLAEKFINICDKYNLTYYMLGGTLLGAVRHKGFIPWDDDMDFGLPRADYEKFLMYAKDELDDSMSIHNIKTGGSQYYYYYTRIEKKNTKLLRTISIDEIIIPVFVDVFPLDNVPDDYSKRNKWIKKCDFYRRLLSISQVRYLGTSFEINVNRNWVKEKIRKIFVLMHLDKLISTKWAWNRLDKNLRKYEYENCECLINFCGAWGLKEMFPKTIYGEGKLYKFEHLLLNGPEDYDYVLSQMYGDYLIPPKDSEKEHHYLKVIQL